MDSTGVKYDIVPSDVALEYRQYFQEILIDEYQDSNLVQEYLLSAISGEVEGHYNRFMVGDVKQSIYKFRLARPIRRVGICAGSTWRRTSEAVCRWWMR